MRAHRDVDEAPLCKDNSKQLGVQVQLGRDRQLSPGVVRVVVKDCEYRVVSLVRPVAVIPLQHSHGASENVAFLEPLSPIVDASSVSL